MTTRQIELKNRQHEVVTTAIVDEAAHGMVSSRKWHLGSNGYAQSTVAKNGKRSTEDMHRFVWYIHYGDIPKGMDVDHRDGNKLNNTIGNLRVVTHRENLCNQASHRAGRLPGATFDTRDNKWQSQIKIDGKKKHLGYFNTEQEAHEAYQLACAKIDDAIQSL